VETQHIHGIEGESQNIKCTRCGLEKFVEEFHRNPSKRTGRESHCKVCVSRRKRTIRNRIKATRKRRQETKVYNVNDFVVEETCAEDGFEDMGHIEFLLKSFILSVGG
jgi:hypothetical protein